MNPDAPDGIDTKGIQLVRRDSCAMIKDASTDILDAIMYSKDTQAALDAARRHVRALFETPTRDIVPKLLVSKTLRNDYKNDTQPHAHVARKMALRRGGVAVPTGTRVPYVIVEDRDNPIGLQCHRAEDPEHVIQHGMTLDVLHYLNLMMSAFDTLLGVLVPDPAVAVLEHPDVADLVSAARTGRLSDIKTSKRVKKNQENGQPEITTFFKVK